MRGLLSGSKQLWSFDWSCSRERYRDSASTCVNTDRKCLIINTHFPVSRFLTVCVCRHTPEWVVKVCMYFFTGTPMALDIDAAGATVTSSRSKGKYGEHLQPQDKRRLYEALWGRSGWSNRHTCIQTHFPLFSATHFWQEIHHCVWFTAETCLQKKKLN